MVNEQDARQCPYCKEEVKADAVKCKHCGSRIGSSKPEHGGTCPFCKESIQPEAILCKHCRSNLQAPKDCGCSKQAVGMSSAPPQMRRMSFPRPGRGGLTRDSDCDSWCQGSTLWCACRVYIPGLGEGILIFTCGTCIDDPVWANWTTLA